ncbi:MAG TPA: hypothetical protein IAC37_00975 [Candidatus Ventrimonas merdavium]|nr:hypothetical protein [Candidatus Ventrimonas merdavium]
MKTRSFWVLPVCQIAASYGAEAIFFYSLFDTKLHPDQDRIMAAVLLILSQCFYVTDVAVLAGYSFWHRIWRRGTVAVILLPVVLTAAAIVWAVVWFLT